MDEKKCLISIMTPCYNEEENVSEIYNRVKEVMTGLKKYNYEHVFIDNASNDKTVDILKEIAMKDKNVKIIINSRNFGPMRSPYYGLLQCKGDAVAYLVADLQDPPGMLKDFIKKWEEGYKIVVGVKSKSEENPVMFAIRKIYYNLISKLSKTELIKNYTGFGLYDREVIEILRRLNEPAPYFRGLICEIGFKRAEIEYTQPARQKGKSKIGFYTLYDLAILGIVNYSIIPLRLAVFIGLIVSLCSFLLAVVYFFYKIIFWFRFQVGMAPLVIGLFFFSSIQLIFIGIMGEYLGVIYTNVQNRPLVIEKERINFD